MAILKILVPQETSNYIGNPSFRHDTTGWATQGASLTRTLARARFGVASGRVETAGAASNEGVFFRVSGLNGVSGEATASVYARGSGRVRIRLDDNAIGGGEFVSKPEQLSDERWTRLAATGRIHGGDDIRLYVETEEGGPAQRTFYVDGAQLETLPYPTTYCDGDQEGCRWNGIYHASVSARAGNTRAGGRWVKISGEDREMEDLYMTAAFGLGVAPLTNNVQNFALEAGGYHQSVKTGMRQITFTFHARNRKRFSKEVSLERLHELRQFLLDAVKPDLTAGDEDILFEYQDGNFPLYFRARYDGGLDGDWDVRNGWVNSFPLRLLAVSPFFEEDSQEAQELNFQDTIKTRIVVRRVNGRWMEMNGGFNTITTDIAFGPRGEVYACGHFTVANNDPNAIDPMIPAVVAKWDGEKWSAIAKTTAGGIANVLDVAPNGDIYVGGTFTSIDGVAANRIARWDGSAWTALGSGLNSQCNTIKAAPNGDIYVGGAFTDAGGVPCYRIAKWSGGKWNRLGQYGGLNQNVSSIDINADGSVLYVGGITNEQGFLTDIFGEMAQYNISSGTFSRMGGGFKDAGGGRSVSVVHVSPMGTVYAGGRFTNETGDIVNIAMWNNGTWLPLGNGLGSAVNDNVIKIDSFADGTLAAVGDFNFSGSLPVSKIALWNGSTWFHADNFFQALEHEIFYSLRINRSTGDFYVGGWNASGGLPRNVAFSGITEIENLGTTNAFPTFYIAGPGTLRWIENQTTGRRMYFNLNISQGEEIFIDVGRGTILNDKSSDRLDGLLPGSDFRSFFLIPGRNRIACFIVQDVNARMSLQFKPRHWSVDAGGKNERAI